MGNYDNGVTYSVNDYVSYLGSSYVMKNYIGGAGYDPQAYPSHWQLVAFHGETGPQGPAGNDGPQGPAGTGIVNWRGVYDWYTTYNTGDVVSWDGSSYAALQFVNSYQYPLYGYPYWQLLAERGATGPQGPQGDPGGGGIGEAPYDGNYYARKDGSWYSFSPGGGSGGGGISQSDVSMWLTSNYSSSQPINFPGWNGSYVLSWNGSQLEWISTPSGGGGGIGDAPYDNYPYVRMNSDWSQISVQSNSSGYSYDSFDSSYYPNEVRITINGQTYAMPARVVY
jgi:hypothetical protein